jgi:serine phosphatase RsbU (regulator of sigma subunit)
MTRFRSLLLTWFFIMAIALLAAVAVFTYLAYQRATDDMTIDHDREYTYVAAARLREELDKFSGSLISVARTDDLTNGDPQMQQAGLLSAQLRLAVFDGGTVVLDNLGRVTATQPLRSELHGQDWSNRTFFSQLLANHAAVYSDILQDGPGGVDVVAFAVPINGATGELRGALVGMFKLGSTTISPFYASIVRLRIGETGRSFLVDSKGKVIYHSDIARTGEDFSADYEVKEVLAGRIGALRTEDELNEDVVAAYAPVPGTSWGLVTQENWQALTASTQRYGRILLVLLGLGMLLPAVGVGQVVRQRHRETLQRERIEQELAVAQHIQKTLLPKDVPSIEGWEVAAHWQPARAVSGDFYDFIEFPDGGLGVVIADVTDKGIPAGLVMASARSILRGVSDRLRAPGQILERVNNLLAKDIPHNMFVTCLYAELDHETGALHYSNAGQNLPYRVCDGRVEKLDATGLPLGLMPGARYDDFHTIIEPGEAVIFYSDGMIEAHSEQREMFGSQRLEDILQKNVKNQMPVGQIIHTILQEMDRFTGSKNPQEDDITLVVIRRGMAQVVERGMPERSVQDA